MIGLSDKVFSNLVTTVFQIFINIKITNYY